MAAMEKEIEQYGLAVIGPGRASRTFGQNAILGHKGIGNKNAAIMVGIRHCFAREFVHFIPDLVVGVRDRTESQR